jgi:hypothetical protein
VYSKKHIRILENRLSSKVAITGKNAWMWSMSSRSRATNL